MSFIIPPNTKSSLTDKRKVVLGHIDRILDHRHTGISDQSSDGAKVFINLFKRSLYRIGFPNITLPCLDFNTVLFSNLSSDLFGVFGRVVNDGNVTAGFGNGLGNGSTDTAVTASDDSGGVFELDCGGG